MSLHTNGCFWEFSTGRYWFSANILESFWYFAVPVFFMISGATLMDYGKRYNLKVYFKKRIHKTGIPFLFWCLVGLVFKLVTDQSFHAKDITLSNLWDGIVGTSYVPIYWFFIPLFVCYLCIPLFAAVPQEKRKRKRLFMYLVGLDFVCNSLAPFLIQVFHLTIKWPFHIEAMGGYLIYILLGYLLSRFDLPTRYRYLLYVLGILGLLAHIMGTYELSMVAGKIIQTYKGYLNVPCLFYSAAVFIFFKIHSCRIMNKMGGIIRFLKDYTFAVYMLHWFVMTIWIRVGHIHTHALGYRMLGPIAIGFVCILVTMVIRKLPYGRRILP